MIELFMLFVQNIVPTVNRIIRKPAYGLYENKDAYQLSTVVTACTADQRPQ